MKLRVLPILTVYALLELEAQQEKGTPPAQSAPYDVGFYSGNPDERGGGYGLQSLVVFPFSGAPYSLRLPFAIGSYDHAADGKVLYANASYAEIAARTKIPGAPERPGLYRVELGTMRMSEVPVNPNLMIFDLAVSPREDKLIVSGRLREGGRQTCGLFEVSLPGGAVKSVLDRPYCEFLEIWNELSVSPDGEKVLARRRISRDRVDLEMINLRRRSVQSLGKGYYSASWSPDGKWVARRDDDGVDLLDAVTLAKKKHLSDTEDEWSPDSRHLIGINRRGCGSYFYTLRSVDIATGARTTFGSSTCKVNRATTAWVNVERLN